MIITLGRCQIHIAIINDYGLDIPVINSTVHLAI
jgi:hypothetical protein